MHDWNRSEKSAPLAPRIVDETLRDGLQSASVRTPPLGRRIEFLHHMHAVGVDVVSVGLPGAGVRALSDAVAIVREIDRSGMPLRATAAARTIAVDVDAVAETAQRAGAPIELYAFIGSSPIRHVVERWDEAFLVRSIRDTGERARASGLPFCLVTEDTSRASPDTLTSIFSAAIDAGVTRLCLCDTAGHSEPRGVATLVRFVRELLDRRGADYVGLDWHGHDDRGLALANALTAFDAGVERLHGTALGVGERVGNVAIEALVHHLGVTGSRAPTRLDRVRAYADEAAAMLAMDIWHFAPVVGDASRRETPSRSESGPAVALTDVVGVRRAR